VTLRRLPVIVLFVFLAAVSSASAAATPKIDPSPHSDKIDVVGGPLDVTTATFGMREARLAFFVQTRTAFAVSDLDPATRNSLCLELYYSPVTTLRSRVCVVPDNGRAGLQYQTIDAAGTPSAPVALDTPVKRADDRTIEASLTAYDLDLPRQKIGWRVTSTWIDNAGCAVTTPCVDLAPDQGVITERIRVLAGPRCFGAESRDPGHACSNRKLKLTVFPSRKAGPNIRNAFCNKLAHQGLLSFCEFGVTEPKANETIALVGDSHAAHWRAALEIAAQAKHWRGLTMMRSGCPLTRAKPILPGKNESHQCQVWNDQILAWFRAHPEIRTVFVAAHRGKTRKSAVAGYHAAWRALPATVRRIVVIREAPVSRVTAGCIRRAIHRHRRPGLACAEPRGERLRSDPEAAAGYSAHSKRVSVVNLTSSFCSSRLCYPVIGGVLVHKDGVHLTRIFSGTLGPVMLRHINRLSGL
jgi:SGNH domain (fused to AT3 domains)